ncbi:hypothetical protein FRC06_006830 [Ceratobasidium sp. 370]|nr:hypothetical protein FRC06_006830 [Ceratobasidium sp. 370]
MFRYIFEMDTSLPTNKQPIDIPLSLVCDWSRHLPKAVQLSRAEHDTILLRCFKYGTSWLLGLVPEIFLCDMLHCLTSAPVNSHSNPLAWPKHYTPMLHCAMLAFACAFSDNVVIRSRETRDTFAVHAKQWLDEELKHPVASLVWSLALLSEYHSALGENDSGYMYMGMSVRAAQARQENSDACGSSLHHQSTVQQWQSWSTFSQDRIMSWSLGGRFNTLIPRFGTSLPAVDSELDQISWAAEPHAVHTEHLSQPRMVTLAFIESCKLMVIAARIFHANHPGELDSGRASAAIGLQ